MAAASPNRRQLAGDSYIGGGEALVPLYFLFICVLSGSVTLFLQQKHARWFPYPLLIFCQGLVWGSVVFSYELGEIGDSFKIWSEIDPFLLMAVLLPALLFGEGLRLNTYELFSQIWEVSIMAIPGVIVNAGLIGTMAYVVLPFGWEWPGCFLFGAILGAPDPVSIMPLLESSNAPKRFSLFLSSESHLGDITTFTLFKIFLTYLTEGSKTFTTGYKLIKFLGANLIGGPLLGVVMGTLVYIFIYYTVLPSRTNDSLCEIAVTLVLAYIVFLVSEHNLAGNGIIATVVASWVVSHYAMTSLSNPESMLTVWSAVEYLANTIIFFLSGVILSSNVVALQIGTDESSSLINSEIVAYAALFWLFLVVYRFLILTMFYPLLKKLSPTQFGPIEVINLTWCGLRGALTLTLAYVVLNLRIEISGENSKGVPNEDIIANLEKYFYIPNSTSNAAPGIDGVEENIVRFYALIGIITIITLSVNYLTAPLLMSLTGLNRVSESQKQIIEYVKKRVINRAVMAQAQFKIPGTDEFKDDYADISEDKLSELITSYRMYLEMQENKVSEEQQETIFDPETVDRPSNDEKLADVRRLFLNAVQGQFWEQIENGTLPKGSNAAKRLFYANAVGLENANETDLDDYTPLRLREDATTNGGNLPFVWLLKTVDRIFNRDGYKQYEKNQLEKDVYTASCYIEAHEIAQVKVAEYVGEDASIDTPEEAYVIKESRTLVKKAKMFMEEAKKISPGVVAAVQTFKVASSMLSEQEKYVTSLEDEKLVDEEFVHKNILEIRKDMRKVNGLAARKLYKEKDAEILPLETDVDLEDNQEES